MLIKTKLVALFIFTSCFLFSQEKINQLNTNGEREGLWKGNYEVSKRPRYEGVFNKGKEVGIFKYFDDTKAGSLIAIRDFSKGDGSCYTIFYDQKNFIVSEGTLKNKIPEGIWKYYHYQSPEIMTIEKYKAGKLNGIKEVFYKNNALAETSTYINGHIEGVYKKFGENAKLIEETNYKDGEMHGAATFYDGNGNLILKGQYKKGLRVGIWETYKDGKIISTENASKPNSKTFKYIKNEKGENIPTELKEKK
uniref:toxin-antitoxin system YwqK family antitoxin n=1 Tax=Flavobacterium sp. TaxID=239 RepID=UPI00404A60EE